MSDQFKQNRLTKNSNKPTYKPVAGETPKINQTGQYTINDVMSELREVKHAINFLSNQYDDLMTKVSAIADENKTIRSENEQIKNDNININNDLDTVKQFINDAKQSQLSNNAILFGMPILQNVSDVKNQFEKIIEKLETGTDIKGIGVTDIYQKKANEGNHNAPIVIKFENQLKKTKLIQLLKTSKITTRDIGLSNNKQIRITDQLTQHNQQLLSAAKQLRSNNYKFIWYNHGRVMVRKDVGTQITSIVSMHQIDALMSQSQ